MQRLFKNAGTALTVTTAFEYTDPDTGKSLAASTEKQSPVKKSKDFERIFNNLETSLDVFKPKDKECKLQLMISLQGKVHKDPVNKVFNDMSSFHKFLVDNNLATENKLKLTK